MAQNDPILVGAEGSKVASKEDMGGYYLLHKEVLAQMIRELKATKKALAELAAKQTHE